MGMIRYEQVSPNGKRWGVGEAFDMDKVATTPDDYAALGDLLKECQMGVPPVERRKEYEGRVFYVFLDEDAERKYLPWITLSVDMAIWPVERVTIDPSTVDVIWQDGEQACVIHKTR